MRKRTTPAIQTFLCIDITNTTAFQLTQLYSKNSNSLASPEKHQPSPLSSTLCQVSVTWAKAGREHWAWSCQEATNPTSWQVAASQPCPVTASAAILLPKLSQGRQQAAKEVGKLSAVPAHKQRALWERVQPGTGLEQHTCFWVAACWAAPFVKRSLLSSTDDFSLIFLQLSGYFLNHCDQYRTVLSRCSQSWTANL